MAYNCFNKYGGFLGQAPTKALAEERMMQANIELMNKELRPFEEIRAYEKAQRAKIARIHQRQKVGAVAVCVVVVLFLLSVAL